MPTRDILAELEAGAFVSHYDMKLHVRLYDKRTGEDYLFSFYKGVVPVIAIEMARAELASEWRGY